MRLPVSIITGFLGSGKTTLLNRLLQDPAMAGAAVIINEFGEIGLDHLLIATPNENTVLLASGCICCTVRGDLVNTLRDLDKQRRQGDLPPFDRVLIETTGLADPVPIVQTVVIDEKLAPQYRLDSVITLVDAVNGAAQLDQQPESRKQAAVADRLLITKTDIADPANVAVLRERLAMLNPAAEVTTASRGAVAPALLFGASIAPESREADVARWLRESEYRRVETQQAAGAHDAGIRSYSLMLDAPVTRAGLTAWLTALASLRGAELLRVKGLLNVEGEPVAVHAVQTLIHEPVTLERWPDDERRSRLVFITRNMTREAVESTLDVLGWQSQVPASVVPKPDPQAYARFLAAMTKMH
ncbi:MAG: GTP-binding protein [Burkholderiales bacterium]|nr:GTP-binding protein [Burkholderiales bacterium]